MSIKLDRTGTIDGLISNIEQSIDEGANGILVIASEKNSYVKSELDSFLKSIKVPICGALFPAIIYGEEKLDSGAIIVPLNEKIHIETICHLSDKNIDYEKKVNEIIPHANQFKTMVIFMDSKSDNIEELLEGLFNILGLNVNYIGGGAGSCDGKECNCIISNDGLLSDCAIMLLSDAQSSIGVAHGWEPIAGPYQVTETDGRIIKTIDWRPAFDVYQEIVEEHSSLELTTENFGLVAMAYPIGIARLDSEKIVRDPVKVMDDGSIMCVGKVPKGVFIDILSSDKLSLLQAAQTALKNGKKGFNGNHGYTLFMECISRLFFLDDHFKKEIKEVSDQSNILIGACTIGEIANSGNDYLEFYNKTSVVGVIDI